MPRYYLHVFSDGLTPDEEGVALANDVAARDHALEGIRSLVCDQILSGYLNLEDRIDVADEDGRVLFSIRFREAFEINDPRDF